MARGSLTLDTSVRSDDPITADSVADRSSPSDPSLGRNSSFSRLNAQAPEFVPRTANHLLQPAPPPMVIPQTHPQIHVFAAPNSPYHVSPQNHGGFHYFGGYGEQEIVQVGPDQDSGPPRDGLSEEVTQKIVNQVEYYFSDANLATTDHLMRFINKDADGFVPMSVVASFKKIKALVSSHSLLANALRTSTKLVVSEDGKKIRRQHPFTDADVNELQSRIVVAENLPEDHSFQNLMRVFSVVGSVKTIRTCPQTSNGTASAATRSGKMDMFFSNKLHAFVEYESVEQAEKAAAELNDERNWRSGLRIRLLLRRTAKSARGKRAGQEGDWNGEEDDVSTSEQPDDIQSLEASHDHTGEENLNEKESGVKKGGRGRGRGKGRGRGQYHNNQNNRGGHPIGTPPSGNLLQNDVPTTKQPPGPRMPDGTRGFAIGRGRPLAVTTS